jgi:glutamate dehydrogenase/leucine dehydrogenase
MRYKDLPLIAAARVINNCGGPAQGGIRLFSETNLLHAYDLA